MKKIVNVCLFSLALMGVFGGCVGDAKEITQDGAFRIEFLFEKDGCKMYRFRDGDRYIYWSNCAGGVERSYSTGTSKHKTVHYLQSVTTE